MKTAIVTIAIGETYKNIFELTRPTIEKYASKIGADFIIIDTPKLSKVSPHFEKFEIYDLLIQYDRITFVDSDIIIRDDCPNLFELVPVNKVGLFNETPFRDNRQHMAQASQTYHIDIIKDYDGSYYNTGVMVVSRLHRDMFKLPSTQNIYNHYDQSYLNLYIQKNHVKIHKLTHHFNRMVLMDEITGEHRLNSYIVHYAGILQNVTNIIKQDLTSWSKGNYNLQKHVILAVGARLGDVVSAEPVIRYMIEKEYKGYDITIISSNPRIFQHLSDKATITTFQDFQRKPDMPYITKNLMVPQEYPVWGYITANATHTVDWMSIQCLKHTIPDKDKQIRLGVSLSGYSEVLDIIGLYNVDMSELVLVHPGKNWPSKTFPATYWEQLTQELVKNGYKVGIIGKDIKEQIEKGAGIGVVQFSTPEGAIDFRNLLGTDGLIALISKAKMLISNDSAPVHIAGAFNHHIILLPTCKHPDHVLPWRNGDKYYKACALYGKPMWDEPCKNPLSLYGYDLSALPQDHDITEYLPTVDTIIKEVACRCAQR